MPNDLAFRDKVQQARARSQWFIELAPRITEMPALIQKYDDPFLPYCRAVFAATEDLVAGYVFDLAAFLALGAAGAVALERAVAIIAVTTGTLSVIHGPFTRPEYASFVGETALRADAATVSDFETAAGFEERGMCALVFPGPMETDVDGLDLEAGTMSMAGVLFRLARQSFLDQYKRTDFESALRKAADQDFRDNDRSRADA